MSVLRTLTGQRQTDMSLDLDSEEGRKKVHWGQADLESLRSG